MRYSKLVGRQVSDSMSTKVVIAIAFIVMMLIVGWWLRGYRKFCGGFAANLPEFQCPFGMRCRMDQSGQDASGRCLFP